MTNNVVTEDDKEAQLLPTVVASDAATRERHARSINARSINHQNSVTSSHSTTPTLDSVSVDDPPISNESLLDNHIVVMHHFRAGVETYFDKFALALALASWSTVGVLAIVTTKMLLQDWGCPALVLTVQQMVLGTIILRLVVAARDGAAQPWPWEAHQQQIATERIENELVTEEIKRYLPWLNHPNFVLAGVFNALEFVASNYAFSFAAAHFVETIKASDLITTTAIALIFKVDKLSTSEAGSLVMLITGVLLSTWANSSDEKDPDGKKLLGSIQAAVIVVGANLCFAFRAINQKKYRSTTHETQQMDDVNFMCRMMQVGVVFLIVPVLLMHPAKIGEAFDYPSETQLLFLSLSLVNAFSFVTYNLASCYILSKLTVLHHSSLNCLRRMLAILATSIFFSSPLSLKGIAGLMTSFLGFASFTFHRNKRLRAPKAKDSNV